jgi:hypothetical protein
MGERERLATTKRWGLSYAQSRGGRGWEGERLPLNREGKRSIKEYGHSYSLAARESLGWESDAQTWEKKLVVVTTQGTRPKPRTLKKMADEAL